MRDADRILQDKTINTEDLQVVLKRLTNNHSIERIAMQRRQGGKTGDARFIKLERRDVVSDAGLRQI